MAKSILSDYPDGAGFYYGFNWPDHRQVNVRLEPTNARGEPWIAYVGGQRIGSADSRRRAEDLALVWMEQNPVGDQGR